MRCDYFGTLEMTPFSNLEETQESKSPKTICNMILPLWFDFLPFNQCRRRARSSRGAALVEEVGFDGRLQDVGIMKSFNMNTCSVR